MTTEHANIVIRYQVKTEDSAAIEKLVAATGYFSQAELVIAVELVDERLAKGTASGYEFVLAEVESVVVGYACFGEIPCTVGSYDLYWIAVDPRYQRWGIGKQLLQQVESQVRQIGGRGIYIDTSGGEQYASSRGFYERCGYRLVANLPDFYGPGDPKHVFWRSLTIGTV